MKYCIIYLGLLLSGSFIVAQTSIRRPIVTRRSLQELRQGLKNKYTESKAQQPTTDTMQSKKS